jgi:dihydroxy-acid dehydratase
MGIDFGIDNWEKLGHDIPLLVNCQPAGEHLMEGFFKAGGVPAVMKELLNNNKLHKNVMTVTGKTIEENLKTKINVDENIIRSFNNPLVKNAGFIVMKSNFFSSAVMKTSVISSEFRERYLSDPKNPNIFQANAVVFEGPEDYSSRINDENLKIDENSILMIRGCGPVGYPGSGEVVNMQPPDKLLKKGINTLPTLGDGRQSGTSESPSILNVSPESAIGGALLIVQTGDKIKIDLNNSRIDLLITDEEIEKRRKNVKIPKLKNQTPWQEISRKMVGQLETGACLETESIYLDITKTKGMPRHSH